ncbi:hypothetical protein ABFW07_16185 [Acinetobacter soli]|uniref:hypothetical protein n=1 Tax=Acinetobacter soli TaxID=487316 RepID=UPI003218574D
MLDVQYIDDSDDNISPEELQKLYDKLIEVIEKTSKNLYRHTIERLKKINPTLDEIAELCSIFITLFEAKGIKHENSASEAVIVIKEAAIAVHSGDAQTVIDCAYHLEDFISRLRSELIIGESNG